MLIGFFRRFSCLTEGEDPVASPKVLYHLVEMQ